MAQGPKEFLRAASALRGAPAVVLVGTSAVLAELALEEVSLPGDEVERVGASDGQLREACELASTPSWFDLRRLVAAWRCEALSGAQGRGAAERQLEAQALADYLAHPRAGATLFVFAPAVDRRLAAVRRAQEAGALLDATPPQREREREAWHAAYLEEFARREGVRLTRGAQRALLESGLELDGLVSALRVTALAVDGQEPVDEATAAWAAPPSGELKVFALTDALLQRRPAAVLLALDRLLAERQQPIGLLGLVTSQLRQLAAVRAELAQGRPPAELAQALSLHPFVAQKLAQAAPRWPRERIAFAFRELLRCDVALKSGGGAAQTLEISLARVARGA